MQWILSDLVISWEIYRCPSRMPQLHVRKQGLISWWHLGGAPSNSHDEKCEACSGSIEHLAACNMG